jgi:N-acyl homoserine lactone hydrolase
MTDIEITPIERGHIRTDINHIIEGFSMGSADEPNPETEMGEGPVYNLVIEGEQTILWDTGSHPDAGEGHWPAELYSAFEHYDASEHHLEDDLEEAGYSIDEIDAVIQSHLHLDHAGGLYNFAGTDVPIYVHEEELKYAYYSAKSDAGSSAYIAADFDHDLNWQVIHRERETHFEGIEFLHLPGHTPGLMGLFLRTTDGPTLVIGDQAYMRANYDDEQPLGAGLLWSKRAWYESLRWIKDLERRENATVSCGHDPEDLARLRG